MNREIWNGIGQIGDDLIADANDSKVRNHFIRRKRNLWIRYGSIAACLCLVVCLCVPWMKMATQNKSDAEGYYDSGIWIKTESNPQNEEPSLPWSHVLAYNLRIEKSEYSPSKRPVMELGYGLSSDVLGSGTLKIDINAGDFTTTVSTEITVKDFTYPAHAGQEANTLTIPLIPPKEDSFGTIKISFLFYPEDPESAEYAEYLSWGALPIGTITLSYVVNEYEMVFSQTNAYDLFELRLVKLYESGTIGAKEFADRYFAFVYRDTICASISVMRPDGSYNFIYRSKNIRYDSPYITDTAIKDAMESTDERLIVRLALEQMRSSGVITQEEYDCEFAWMEEVQRIGTYDIGFDQNVAKYAHNVLQKNMYTHQ